MMEKPFWLCVAILIAAFVPSKAPGDLPERVSNDAMERGELVASGGGPGGPPAACFACHGVNGEGQASAGAPALAGLSPEYQFKQLNDFAAGARLSDLMAPIARSLSSDDRWAVSVFYAHESGRSLVAPAAGDRDPLLIQEGGVLFATGDADRGLQGCITCHGPGARELRRAYPALAGQPAQYIANQLRHWRNGTRNNDIGGVMKSIAERMTEREIQAVSEYLSSLVRAPHADGVRLRPHVETDTP